MSANHLSSNKNNDNAEQNDLSVSSLPKPTAEALPPAVTLPLAGRHLIEASAGTGKTWTLTGILLRLLVEAGHPTDKIIATTFTRSAAAEMRQRIRERLNDLYRLLSIANQHDLKVLAKQATNVEAATAFFMEWLAGQAQSRGLTDAYQDPINQHLMRWISQNTFSHASLFQLIHKDARSPTADEIARPKVDFRIALQRTNAALNQLDRLFVSTIDSLCQKWLREFSSETGFSADVQISNDVESIVLGMIHDQLRAFWANLYQHEPEIFDLMQANKKLIQAHDFYPAVEKALNFYTAPIDVLPIKSVDLDAIRALMQQIANYYDDDFNQYLDESYRKAQGFNGSSNLYKKFALFPRIQEFLGKANVIDLLNVTGEISALWVAIKQFYDEDKGFNKNREAQKAKFKSFKVMQDFEKLLEYLNHLNKHFDDINRYFTQFISRYVRDNLPNVLEAQRLTTFSLQLARLNRALQGQQGEALARYIRHQYPIALIDESQDINTEQALLIQRIYLEKHKDQAHQKQTPSTNDPVFLLLVGDPKQAIYGFRGGDVTNYTTLKQLFDNKPLALTQNRRSSKALIDTLNHWYGVAEGLPDRQSVDTASAVNQAPFYLGESIFYQPIEATRESPALVHASAQTLPTFYHLNVPVVDKNDEASFDSYDVVTAEILSLLDIEQTELKLDHRAIKPTDICVLASKRRQLDAVERKLHRAGVATIRGGSQSVFGQTMSEDLVVLMTLLLSPYNKSKLKSLLLTSFFQLTLAQANALTEAKDVTTLPQTPAQTIQQLDAIQNVVSKASELWQKESFLVAIQWLLNQQLTLTDQPTFSFWQRLARHKEGERLLIDLRQIIDLISERFSGQVVGEYQLLDWLRYLNQQQPKEEWALQQRLPSESGVELMTIHASKGLEFPIVFILGMSDGQSSSRKSAPLFLYTNPDSRIDKKSLLKRRLTARINDDHNLIDYQAGEKESEYEESLRLLYVALTRARERVYLVTQQTKNAPKSKTPLNAFVQDIKNFTLTDGLQHRISEKDINSLSKYINQDIKYTPKQSEQPLTQPIDYQTNLAQIGQYHFQGWANTSFTALSRFMHHERHDAAVHEADYDGFDDVVDETLIRATLHDVFDSSERKPTEANETPHLAVTNSQSFICDWQKQPIDIDTATMSNNPVFIDDSINEVAEWAEGASPTDLPIFDSADIPVMNQMTLDDWQANHAWDIPEEVYYDQEIYQGDIDHTDYDWLFDSTPTVIGVGDYPLLPNQAIEESELLRFRFEKGTAAGTFLHQVLEDLANSYFDDNQGYIDERGVWIPPARWSVIIDRALRQQQLPAQYFSTQASSEGIFQSGITQDLSTLQPEYLALATWLNDVIHTPFSATQQRPADIRQQQKAAEMGFNMRLNQQLSLRKLNALFNKYHVELQLQEDFNPTAMWQYLRGEIDLVYQHNHQYFVVDYKSNYLGSHFADYHQSALQKSMTEHSYWLQASIYQVALHRFLQLRLPDYDPEVHLGAVEYAFIRGMSSQHSDYGSIVWQPKIEFIHELDALFGR